MNIIVTILIILGSLVALFLIIAFFTKRELQIERHIAINRSAQDVYNYTKLLKNQEKYSVWVMKDPNINLVYTGVDGTVGFISSWTSNDKNVGIGAQEIMELDEAKRMKVEVRFKKPFESTAWATTTFTPDAAGQTNVSMVFDSKAKFPMNFSNLFVGKMVGNDMQKNLVNLKNNLES